MTFDLATISTAIAADPKKSSRAVVATPTGGARSFAKFQRAAATSPVSKKTSPPRAATPGRDRQKSPGRTGSRSRDIVQEVYDRMGVNYKRGQSTFELDDNNSIISIHSATKSVSKSPSRNRANARYMHSNNQTNGADSRGIKCSASSGLGRRWSSSRSMNGSTNGHSVVVFPSKKDTAPRYSNTTPSDREDGSFPTAPRKQPSLELDSRDDVAEDREVAEAFGREDIREDTEERREGPPAQIIEAKESGRASPLSVKSRISVWSGAKNTSKRPSETSWLVDSNGNVVKPVNRYKGAKSSLANSYMAAINGSKSGNPPVTKPPVTRHNKVQPSDFSITSIPVEKSPSDTDADANSVAPSEISVEDFTAIASRKDVVSRSAYGKSKSGTPLCLTKEMVDQMIEEELQAKFAQFQITIEDQLRLVEEQANDRLNEMEKKLDTLTTGSNDEQTAPTTPQSPSMQPVYLRSFRR